MAVDFRKYTADEAAKQLVLLEIHMRQFDADDAIFCLECVGKHLLAIEGLSDEGVTFFPEHKKWWVNLEGWARGVRNKAAAGEATDELTRQWADQSREYRKEIQSKYMGAVGKCECVTGFELCCPRKRTLP